LSTYVVGIPQDLILPVSSLNPVSGVPGTEVTISGSGFSTNATDNLVTFSGPGNTSLLATVIAATATSLSVKVPFGSVTGSVMVRVGSKSSFAMTYSVPGVSNPSPGGGTSNSIQLGFLGGGAGGGGTNPPAT